MFLCVSSPSDDIPMFIRQCELNNVNVFNQQDGHIIRRDGVETSRKTRRIGAPLTIGHSLLE